MAVWACGGVSKRQAEVIGDRTAISCVSRLRQSNWMQVCVALLDG